MLGFGPRLNTVFKSRWKAVVWSACVLLTAYCTVPIADSARRHDAVHKTAKTVHKSPWSY